MGFVQDEQVRLVFGRGWGAGGQRAVGDDGYGLVPFFAAFPDDAGRLAGEFGNIGRRLRDELLAVDDDGAAMAFGQSPADDFRECKGLAGAGGHSGQYRRLLLQGGAGLADETLLVIAGLAGGHGYRMK